PLDEGFYVRGGKRFTVEPCVWIFAGTERPKRRENQPKSFKGSDFESRLSAEPFDLIVNTKEPKTAMEVQIEDVYLRASLLHSLFADVKYVDRTVLNVFHRLPVGWKTRDLKQFVRSFTDIQDSMVLEKNIPFGWLNERGANFSPSRPPELDLDEIE